MGMQTAFERNLEELAAPLGSALRPVWRGRTHMFAFLGAIPAFVVLIVLARGASATTGAAIYGAGVCAMFGVSATYHRLVHTLRARAAWQRADHATIYAAIAGSCTPICLVAMPSPWGVTMLVLVWVGAAFGMLIKVLAWRHAEVVGGVLYLVLGWAGMGALPSMWQRNGVWPALCLIAGGVLYTIGAIGFALERPRLRQAVFGYHEVWHLFTIAAATTQLVGIWAVVT